MKGQKIQTKDKKLLDAVDKYCKNILEAPNTIEELAKLYIKDKIIPTQKRDDARHVAVATINEMDYLVSWNFKHLANARKQIKIRIVNEKEGYFYPLYLSTPLEVMYEDK